MRSKTNSAPDGKEKVEVKQVSDREIWIEKTRFYIGGDNILYITAVGELDDKMAIRMKEIPSKLAKIGKGESNVCIDLNRAGKASPGARKIIRELNEDKEVGKVAVFGMHPVARVVASFIMGVTKKKDIRFFKTKEDALKWLKK